MWRPWNGEISQPQEEENNIEVVEDMGMAEDLDDNSERQPTEESKAKRIHLSPDAKQIVLNVFECIKNDEGVSGAVRKTSRMTKVPESSVRKIVTNGVQNRKVREDAGSSRIFKDHHACLIRRMIYDAYKVNVVLTLQELHRKVVTDLQINCCVETLRTFLEKIEFYFKKIDKRQVLMESPRISKWRVEYLNKIKIFRDENRAIIYLDETWYDTHDTVKKGWCDKSKNCVLTVPTSHGKRIIILHAGSESGWIEDALFLSAKNVKDSSVDYHDNMTGELFENWFENRLLPKLSPHTVIVLDNASYHSVQTHKIPNSSSNKKEIQIFLTENDLYFEESYTKKQLLEVLHTKHFEKSYKIDNMAEQRGHTVLRLPPYHCIFNPIEMIWSELKANVRRGNTSPKFSSTTINVIKDEVARISPENWYNCVRHVIKEENVYREKLVAELIIELGDESSDESDNFSD